MSRRWLLALLPLVPLAPPAAAERLTLTAAAQLALERHPALAAARARLTEARESVGEAAAARGPVARASLLVQQYGEPMPVTPIHGFSPQQIPEFDETLLQAGLSATYTLFDSGARGARLRQADAIESGTAAALAAAEQALTGRVAALWTAVAARAEIAAAQEARVAALAAELERSRRLLAAGKIPEVERLRAEAAHASAAAEATRAASALDLTERDLARLIGEPAAATRAARLEPWTPGAAAAPARDDLARRAAEASPQVEQARRQLAAARAAHALARAAWFPELKVTGALQELGAPDLDPAAEWNLGLQLNVLLWDGGQTGRRVARAAAAIDSAAATVADAELEAGAAVDRALAAGEEAAARADALASAVARLVEVARIQKLLLEAGAGTQVDYLAAEAELAATRAALADARAQALVARVELARATGALTPAWLAAPLETGP